MTDVVDSNELLTLLYGMNYADAEAVMMRTAEGTKNAIYRPHMATIERVLLVQPIPGADFIEYAEVGHGKMRYGAVVQKGKFAFNDQCIMFAPDALLPQADVFAFMAQHGWKVRMKRFKGVPSEVLVLPLRELFPEAVQDELEDGTDVTPWLGVLKYEKDYPEDSGIDGDFPPFVPKTDEPLFQNVPHMVEFMRGVPCYATVKCDGVSQTVMYVNGDILGCSRRSLFKKGEGLVWRMIRKYDLERKLDELGMNIAIQWEAVGPGIQSNTMKLREIDIRVFNVYDIDDQQYLEGAQVYALCQRLGLPMVDIVWWDLPFGNWNDDEIRMLAEGMYDGTETQQEGIVVRPMEEARINNERVSFKIINLRYKG